MRRRRPLSKLEHGGIFFAILLTSLSLLVDRRPLTGPGAGEAPRPELLELLLNRR